MRKANILQRKRSLATDIEIMEEKNLQIDGLKNIEGAIEAILYAAGYPVKYAKLAEVLGLDIRNTKKIIDLTC